VKGGKMSIKFTKSTMIVVAYLALFGADSKICIKKRTKKIHLYTWVNESFKELLLCNWVCLNIFILSNLNCLPILVFLRWSDLSWQVRKRTQCTG